MAEAKAVAWLDVVRYSASMRFFWAMLDRPQIRFAAASGLRVDGGRVRVHVIAHGVGVLRCGDQRVFVHGRTQTTFTVFAQETSLTVSLRTLRGTTSATVDVPPGKMLDHIPAVPLLVPAPHWRAVAFRPPLTQRGRETRLRAFALPRTQPVFAHLTPTWNSNRIRFGRPPESPT